MNIDFKRLIAAVIVMALFLIIIIVSEGLFEKILK
jgi:hypothetical protein